MTKNHTWATAGIRIVAPQVGVDEIARRIGVVPHYRFPKHADKFRQRGIWYLASGLDTSHKPREHLKILIDFIRAHMAELKELTKSYPAEVSCAFASTDSQVSFGIESETLGVLAEARFNLFLSLYPPGGVDEWIDEMSAAETEETKEENRGSKDDLTA